MKRVLCVLPLLASICCIGGGFAVWFFGRSTIVESASININVHSKVEYGSIRIVSGNTDNYILIEQNNISLNEPIVLEYTNPDTFGNTWKDEDYYFVYTVNISNPLSTYIQLTGYTSVNDSGDSFTSLWGGDFNSTIGVYQTSISPNFMYKTGMEPSDIDAFNALYSAFHNGTQTIEFNFEVRYIA